MRRDDNMAEIQNISFSHKEITELLIKKQNLHEGLWGIYVEFGFGAAIVNQSPDKNDIIPAAITSVLKIGIQRFPTPNNLTVDAAEVNPE